MTIKRGKFHSSNFQMLFIFCIIFAVVIDIQSLGAMDYVFITCFGVWVFSLLIPMFLRNGINEK